MSLKSVLKVDPDLIEWTLKVIMSIPAFHPEIVENTTILYGSTNLS